MASDGIRPTQPEANQCRAVIQTVGTVFRPVQLRVMATARQGPGRLSAGACVLLREAAVHRSRRASDLPCDPVAVPCQGNGIVLKTPHGVTAPAPLMLCVPAIPGM
jgi:hypothetical protein